MPYCPRCRAEYRDGFTRCADCNVDCFARGEWYEVPDELWESAGMSREGHLCIGCLEARLGRKLRLADFGVVESVEEAPTG